MEYLLELKKKKQLLIYLFFFSPPIVEIWSKSSLDRHECKP